MMWRFGLLESTFAPLVATHWALGVALASPLLLGLMAALLPPKRAWPVALACLSVLASGLGLLFAFEQSGCCDGSGNWLVSAFHCA